MRKNSIKNTRINGEVKKELSVLINREIKDPRINPMTSVIDVFVAPDLKTAKVYISVMGDEESKKDTIEGLKSAASFIRSQLARNLNMRNTPELTFILDNSIEYAVNMSKLIDEVNSQSSGISDDDYDADDNYDSDDDYDSDDNDYDTDDEEDYNSDADDDSDDEEDYDTDDYDSDDYDANEDDDDEDDDDDDDDEDDE